jgi:predicted RecB family nuclease
METPSQPVAGAPGQGPAPDTRGDRLLLSGKDLAYHLRPSPCDLRVYLREHGAPVAPPSPFDDMISRLGRRHEVVELTRLQPVVNLSDGPLDERARQTRSEVANRAEVIYQGVLKIDSVVAGLPATLVAIPDFLVRGTSGYAIRDSRLAAGVAQEPHQEVVLRLQLAGHLFRETLGQEPTGLEVATGRGVVVNVDDDAGVRALERLAHLARLKRLKAPPYEAVGWSKCHACAFVRSCWREAVDRGDVACLPVVDESLARTLHGQGVDTVAMLLETFDRDALAALGGSSPAGSEALGNEAADAVLRAARALQSGHDDLFALPDLPLSDNYVAFDSEGLPPQYDELDRVYVWGIRVFGTLPSPYTAAMATGDPDGDYIGWFGFLTEVAALFGYYGDLPFVHWGDDERLAVERYIERHGDPDGVAARVLTNLIDLEELVRSSVALPLPSNDLRAVSRYAGAQRELDQYGRDWSLAKYMEVVETGDEFQRSGLVGQVQTNSREDLEATYVVLRWLLARAAERR